MLHCLRTRSPGGDQTKSNRLWEKPDPYLGLLCVALGPATMKCEQWKEWPCAQTYYDREREMAGVLKLSQPKQVLWYIFRKRFWMSIVKEECLCGEGSLVPFIQGQWEPQFGHLHTSCHKKATEAKATKAGKVEPQYWAFVLQNDPKWGLLSYQPVGQTFFYHHLGFLWLVFMLNYFRNFSDIITHFKHEYYMKLKHLYMNFKNVL